MRTAVLLLTSLALAACGSETGAGDGDVGLRTPATDLTVMVKTGPQQPERTFTLTCDPPSGDHPDPEAACRSLADLDAPFAPVPERTACTEQYGGPQTARVTGTYRGEPVDARFERTNGCEIARWQDHAELLVVRGGA